MAERDQKKKQQHEAEEAEHGTVASVPLDVLRLILLKATPLTLWSSRLVCKHWYSLITSPEFVAARRTATGGAWLAISFQMRCNIRPGNRTRVVKAAWVLIYNPLLNSQEKVSIPIYQAWPQSRSLLLYGLHISSSELGSRLTLRAAFARSMCFNTWNPVSGSIDEIPEPAFRHNTMPQRPQDVAGPTWTRKYTEMFKDLMAFSVSGLKIFRQSTDTWEFMGAMPDDMWGLMRESDAFFVATRQYYLIWTQHGNEPEMLALFQPTKGSWTWVDNIWHSWTYACRWNEIEPAVLSCF